MPFKGATLNIPVWKSLIEKAGYKVSDMPKTWDAYFDFFEPVQKKLRAKGMRHTYGLGYTLSTTGDDPNNLFNQFLMAYWNLMKATAVIYALPPIAIYYAFRRHMSSGLTMGGVKG